MQKMTRFKPAILGERNIMQANAIKELIEAGLAHSNARVQGDGTHFTVIVICPEFTGKSRLQRQQLVNETVKTLLLDGSLHALSMKTFTPEEWDHQAKENKET